MDILIDTNVILDHLCSRQPYSENAGKILRLCFQNAHYIITRNIDDFPNSTIPVILPEDFLKIIEEQQKQVQ
jgi:hypothetical protein